jgi:hypothetical protein
MWGFQTKRNTLREQLLQAPEVNPSEFVRRYLLQKPETPFKGRARFELIRSRAGLKKTPAFDA